MKYLYITLLTICLFSCKEKIVENKKEITPSTYYASDFFHEVQMNQLFSDGKTFTDCLPKIPYHEIIALYNEKKHSKDFNLKEFVSTYYTTPKVIDSKFKSNKDKSMAAHILSLWPELTRDADDAKTTSSLLPLPKKYVVPGGRFREIYYWDSYFTLEGLLLSNPELAENMVDNFAYLIDKHGFIPNGNRDYYLTRSQPPFFSLMVNAISRADSTKLLKYVPQLEKEYAYWMQKNKVIEINGEKYNRYYDEGATPRPESYREDYELAVNLKTDAEKEKLYRNLRTGAMSGWDYSSRWFADNKNLATIEIIDILPVDLNCLLYYLENLLSKAYTIKGNTNKKETYANLANTRKNNIRKLFWNPNSKFFEDYHIIQKSHTTRKTLAAAFPLFVNIATKEQAKEVEKTLNLEFLKPGGYVTSLTNSSQQWDAPNGWAPLQWVTIKGLENYGYVTPAKTSAKRWLHLNKKIYKNTGKMMEKYNVEDTTLIAGGGEYPNQDGFGWTNGIAIKLKQEYLTKE